MQYRDAKFTANGNITCTVNHPRLGWVPYTASADDTELFSRTLHAEILRNGDAQPYVAPIPTDDELAILARAERNALLAASDWTQTLDAPVDRAAWAAYRQALRDITAQAGFPRAIDWPERP